MVKKITMSMEKKPQLIST